MEKLIRAGTRLALLTTSMLLPWQAQAQAPEAQWQLLDSYCSECHNSDDWAGGLAFDLMSPQGLHNDADVWEQVVRRLRGRLMPPPGSPQPDQARIDDFVHWMEGSLDANLRRQMGHVPLHRLNRTEYALTIKHLLGVQIDAREFLPTDIEVEGFDNIASALTVSPAFLDQFVDVARHVARLAVGEQHPKVSGAFYPATGLGSQDGYQPGMPLGTRGGMLAVHNFPADGEYLINILDLDVGLYPRGIETEHTLVLLIDGNEVFRENIGGGEDFTIANQQGAPGAARIMERFANIPVYVQAGQREVAVTFIERSRAETDELIGGFVAYGGFAFQGSLRVPRILDGIEVKGPNVVTGVSDTPGRERVFTCRPLETAEEVVCAARIAEHLAQRAWRQPVTQDEIESLMPFYHAGYDSAAAEDSAFEKGVEHLVAAIIASPDFLFRSITPVHELGDAEAFALDDIALASRLSFFLWGHGPDDALLDMAISGQLGSDPSTLETQVLRMLDDPRAANLVDSFALKWLNITDLGMVVPDTRLFPEFNAQLQEDFSEELRRFIASVMLEDRPILELLSADYTFLNERLARHYGIDDVHGAQFRRVTLSDDNRWGLLGKAAVLMRTSYGDRTSPVLRGAWVLEKLLGTPPAPPPPNVETDLSVQPGQLPTTVRARLEQHRENPGCNQCHGVIDPIGLALENFSVTGRWQDLDPDALAPIDASTVLPNGKAIEGPAQLRQALMERPEQFALAFTERLMMYALGRELEYFDMPQVRAIARAAAADDYRLSSIVLGIVNSEAFRYQGMPHDDVAQVASRAGGE